MKNKASNFLLQLDRTLSHGLWSQLLLLFILMIGAFVFANFLLLLSPVDWESFCRDLGVNRWIAPFYLLIDGNAFTSVYEKVSNQWTVFLACLIYIIGVFLFTGMMVSVMTNMIERRVEIHRSGLVFYLKKGHYVIMGYDDTITSFINYVFGKDSQAYVLVFTSVEAGIVREKLLKSFTQEQLKRIIINYGHRTSAEDYPKIHLESARELFIVGYLGNQAHDAINVECVDSICRYLSQTDVQTKPSRITCVFRDLDTYAAFKTTEIFTEVANLGIEFVPYNYHAGWARQVLVNRSYRDVSDNGKVYTYPAVYRDGITENDGRYVHLVFVGTTNFAVALATEAAHILHFPNYKEPTDIKTRITFIEVNADREKDEFITRYRHLFEVQPYLYRDISGEREYGLTKPIVCTEYLTAANGSQKGVDHSFLDVQFEFIKGDIFSRKVQALIGEWANDGERQYLSLFIALANHRTNFVMAMNMPDEVYDNGVPIFIRQGRSDNFVTNLRNASLNSGQEPFNRLIDGELVKGTRPSRYSNIYPFGMDETAFYSDEIHLKRAKLINYLYQTADYGSYKFKDVLFLDAIPNDTIWKDADAYWRGLTVALKWSNLYCSYTIDTKMSSLRAIRGLKPDDDSQDLKELTETEIDVLSQMEHNRWNVEKLLMGYRKPRIEEDAYRASKADDKVELARNKEHYIHHDIRPYKELDHIAELDREFSRSLPWVIRMTADE